jgi:site-specific recombinase XerD
MISDIRPKSYQHFLSLPILGSILDEFTTWSHQRGYTVGTVRNQLKDARQIDGFFRQSGAQCLSDLTHSAFETAWYYYRHRRPNIAGTTRQIERFLGETRGLDHPPPQPKTPTSSELDRFADYLRNVRGLEMSTIQSHTSYLQNFLKYICYDANAKALTKLTSKEIEGFLCICARRLNRHSLQHVVGYLRAFLRFQYEQGVLQTPLYTMIDTPRVYRLEQLPRSLPWEMVDAFLCSIDRVNPHGIRDYTMFFLMATYGLRACEIVWLTLDDIDWQAGLLRIPQRKTDNRLILPLTDAAGDVLIEYLRKSRPKLPYRELFLRVRAPHGPLKPTAVTEAFQLRIRLSGLDIPYQGPHCLRHSYAVHMLRQGTSVKAIGDLLGHRSAESTCVYLRLAIEDLRSVALPVPQGSSVDMSINVSNCRSSTSNQKKATKSFTKSSTPLRSFLAEDIQDYLKLKRSLGRTYGNEANTLHSLDAFLVALYPPSKDLTAEMFKRWCTTLYYLCSTVRRKRMRVVRNFCLYRCRSRPQSFVPDALTFPANHQRLTPYIFSDLNIARLLSVTRYLGPYQRCPLRSQTIRIAIILLYTTGLRRGELLRLTLGDFNSAEATLLIQVTKFHKSRIIPLSFSVAAELDAYLALRRKSRLPMEMTSPLLWNGYGGPEGKCYTGTGLASNWAALCTSLEIFTRKGKPPRIHDLRHSFAVNVLQKWYHAGEDVQAKLPMLSTYMGHVSIVSTHYYLTFIEGIRLEASARFYQNFGKVITADVPNLEQECLEEFKKNGGTQ